MKKIKFASILAAIVVLASSLVTSVSAESETDTVFVTISDGSLALAYEEVALTDADGDGALTVNDALTTKRLRAEPPQDTAPRRPNTAFQ